VFSNSELLLDSAASRGYIANQYDKSGWTSEQEITLTEE